MKKLLIFPLIIGTLYAQSFEQFLDEATTKSPYLRANSFNVKEANERAEMTTRYKNPSLSLELSNFSPDVGSSDVGYRVGVRQPLRLWGVGDARERVAKSQKEESISLLQLTHAKFVREISLLYTLYKASVAKEKLANEELGISQKIAQISKERYSSGTIARVKYMQAVVDTQRVENRVSKIRVERLSYYYKLIAFAGLEDDAEIETAYSFGLSEEHSTKKSASLALLKTQKALALTSSELYANRVEWVNLYGEFEQEPDQSIARVGVEIPLVVFNTKKEEKTIATLEAKKLELLTQNTQRRVIMQLKELDNSIEALEALELSTQKLLLSQQELLTMHEEAYKIASIDLVELQLIKNQMIATKESLIATQLQKEQKIIEHNYLVGDYNE